MTLPVRITVLGTTGLSTGGRIVPLRSVQQRRLVAALALGTGRPLSSDQLAEAVWGDRHAPADPSAALHNLVSRVRAALGESAMAIETTSDGYRLSPRVETDVAALEAAIHAARSSDRAIVADQLATLLRPWPGDPYADLDTDEARIERERLRELRDASLEDVAESLLVAGDTREAVEIAEGLCASAPLRERPRLVAAEGMAKLGRAPQALRLLDDFRRTLAAELGIEPSASAAHLASSILAGHLDTTARQPGTGEPAPRPAGRVFGRDADIAAVGAMLDDARLVTLIGPGGVGKTTLALSVAARRESVQPVAFVDLGHVEAPGSVDAAFASACAVQRADDASWVDRLAEVLHERHVTIVVDNAEHVLDATSRLIDELVHRTRHTTFLVTSRERLAISGERVWPVEPLAVSANAAVALFCDRAAASLPTWRPTGSFTHTVEAICRRVNGLPLAIELAATQVRNRTLEEINADLAQSLDLLDRGTRTPARHGTLRAAMDWSYALLHPDAQVVFDRLGVFIGGFSREQAAIVCADVLGRDDATRVVETLVDCSLVRHRPRAYGSRFDLLDTIRLYSREHLAQHGTLAQAHDAHAVAVALEVRDAVQQLWGPGEQLAVVRLDDDRANILSAYRWLGERDDVRGMLDLAVDIGLFAWIHGRADLRDLSLDSVRHAEQLTEDLDVDPLLALAFGTAADAALTSGDRDLAARYVNAGLDAAARAGDDIYARTCHGVAADLDLFDGNADAAATRYRRSAIGFAAVGNAAMAAYLDAASGLALTYGGRVDDARPVVESAVARADATGCTTAQAFTRYALAELMIAAHDVGARSQLEEAIELADVVDATFVRGVAGISLAGLLAADGDINAALREQRLLIDLWRRSGNWTQQWNTLRTLAPLLVRAASHEGARNLMAELTAHGAQPTWGSDAAAWATAADAIANVRLPPFLSMPPDRLETLALAEAAIDDALAPRG